MSSSRSSRRRRPRLALAARAAADPAHDRGHVPVRDRRRQLVVRPADARARPSSTGACCRSSRRTAARRSTSCRRTSARPGRSRCGRRGIPRGRAARSGRGPLPGVLVRGLLGWHGDTDAVVAEWLWCRRIPAGVRRVFRSGARLGGVPRRTAGRARRARDRGRDAAAARPRRGRGALPDAVLDRAHGGGSDAAADVLHVTAAGWSAIPALVHKALHGTPMVLTEHGVYLREAYLAAARGGGSPGARFTATRLARGLARSAYAGADVICPVTDANAYWEMSLGVDPAKILVLYNGLRQPAPPTPPPGRRRGRVGRADRPAQGHPHAAAGGGRDAAGRPGRPLSALRRGDRGRGGLRALLPRAARAARARRAVSLHGPHDRPERRPCAAPTWC